MPKKQRLEQLDPRFSVDITATADSSQIQIRPVQPIPALPRPKILDETKADELKAFFEEGQSFQVKAAKVEVPGFPIHNNLLRELGDAENGGWSHGTDIQRWPKKRLSNRI